MKAETAEYLLNLEKKIESEGNRKVFYSVFIVSLFSFWYDYYLGRDFADWSPISKIFIIYSIFHIYVVIFMWKVFIRPSAENAILIKKSSEEEKSCVERMEEERIKRTKKKSNDEYLFGKK